MLTIRYKWVLLDEVGNPVWHPFTLREDAERYAEREGVENPTFEKIEVEVFTKEGKKPPPVFRMARCRNCPYHNKPCLTINEAYTIMEDGGKAHDGTGLCNKCDDKSRQLQKEEKEEQQASIEEMLAEIEDLKAKLGVQ